ncbi:MAG TPA: GGDEF domain-containing protein, partial [Candidatus Saccharimonadales bacterium]|nr:GGDEF domain-containing protein [Candidatus Saccharimonadales bacterium]
MGSPDTNPAKPENTGSVAPGDQMSDAEVVHPAIWHDLVDSYVDRARMDHTDLSVLLVDIDATKAINDELGHQAGNRLIEAVDRITGVVPGNLRRKNHPRYPDRPLDVVTAHSSEPPQLDRVVRGLELPPPQTARIGGDEFGILLPMTGREGANVVANRVRASVDEELEKPENHELAEIGSGVSIGVASLEPGMNASDFLRLADQAMYSDKLRQLRVLSPDERSEFMTAVEHLKNAGVRPRDVPKYVKLFGALSLNEAFEGY